jgi:uncharacterized membrane protein
MEIKNSKQKAKKVIKEATSKTIKFYKHLLIVIFILIIVYTIVISIFAFLEAGTNFLTNVATISVGGFWAFFLGYFGWRMGQTIEEYFKKIK